MLKCMMGQLWAIILKNKCLMIVRATRRLYSNIVLQYNRYIRIGISFKFLLCYNIFLYLYIIII